MLSDFSYTLISPIGQGGDFLNTCNQILDFQSHEYEVCIQDMLFLPGAWQNVREGFNSFKLQTANVFKDHEGVEQWMPYDDRGEDLIKRSYKSSKHHEITLTVPPGFYFDRREFINIINDVIAVGVTEYEARHASAPLQKLNGRFIYEAYETGFGAQQSQKDRKHQAKVEGRLHWQATDALHITRVEFGKEVSFLLGIIPMLTSHIPSLRHGWQTELTNVDLYRNNLTLIWIFAY